MKRSFVRSSLISLLFFVVVLVLTAATPQKTWAHSNGINGFSGNPATNAGGICTDCHYGGSLPAVAITGPASLATGTAGVYTLTITGSTGAMVGGLDVSATAGTLQATGANTQLMSGEVTHTSPVTFPTGSILSFTFTLVAPATAGSLTLYGAGLSANNDKHFTGDNAAGATFAVSVTAPSVPQIVISPANLQIAFGTVNDGLTSEQTVTISNSGIMNLAIGQIGGVNSLAAPFSIPAATDNCSNQAIAPAGACTFTVRFAPTAAGTFNDSFDIPNNDPTKQPSVTMSVSGTGSNPPSQIVILPANLQIAFGTVNDGLTSDQTVTISNSGSGNLTIGQIGSVNSLAAPFSIPVAADNCSNKTLASGGACTLIVQFAPASGGAFTDSFDIPSNDPTVTMSMSGTGNALPTAPTLVSPTDGQTVVGTTATLVWNKSTDPDNDTITYHLYNCPGDPSASCTPVNVASNGMAGIYFAGSGLLFVGFSFARGGRGRKLMLTLMIALLLMSGAVFISCGGGSSGSSAPATVSYQVSGLSSATTYYWKVVADDGNGLATSQTWSFKTQ